MPKLGFHPWLRLCAPDSFWNMSPGCVIDTENLSPHWDSSSLPPSPQGFSSCPSSLPPLLSKWPYHLAFRQVLKPRGHPWQSFLSLNMPESLSSQIGLLHLRFENVLSPVVLWEFRCSAQWSGLPLEKTSLTTVSEIATPPISSPSCCFIILSTHHYLVYIIIYICPLIIYPLAYNTTETGSISVFNTVFLVPRTFPGTQQAFKTRCRINEFRTL